MSRPRLRDLNFTIGTFPTGKHNAITDVPDILVGHTTLIHDGPRAPALHPQRGASVARTGVTVILPRRGEIWRDTAPAGIHSFNGCGEMTGSHWIAESGMLSSPIAITCTQAVGVAHTALGKYGQSHGYTHMFALPVVAETYDGRLNDADAHHLTEEHVFQAIASASNGPVAEGNVGGGTGMICHGFKGGIGTASRIAENKSGRWTIGVLVQANYGRRHLLRVDGVPVGRELGPDVVPLPSQPTGDGSIIIIIATDAPLIPAQCQRLAQRATVGLARVGGIGHNFSGDIFLAFSTGNHVPDYGAGLIDLKMMPHEHMDALFEATAEATEEAILNALCAAETMTGYQGFTAHAMPQDKLVEVMRKYRG